MRAPGDPPLSARGVIQAQRTGRSLKGAGITGLYSSPLRRARETAELVAADLGLEIRLDDRLRERMNWGLSPVPQTAAEFLAEWARATRERDFVPLSGDSSHCAGGRFASLLDELSRRHPGERVALVSHGGVTVDLLRTLFGDALLSDMAPGLIEAGVLACAVTHLGTRRDGYVLSTLASVEHLVATERTGHRPD